jgi:methylornithine synthase
MAWLNLVDPIMPSNNPDPGPSGQTAGAVSNPPVSPDSRDSPDSPAAAGRPARPAGLSARDVEAIAGRAAEGRPPGLGEMEALLSLPPGPAAEALMRGAEALRAERFGSSILLYGFVYLSTHCRNNCSFCHYRSELSDLERYRLEPDDIVAASLALARSGVNLIDLTMGEDEDLLSEEGFERLLGIVGAVAEATALPVMLSPGLLGPGQLRRAREAGAVWYALYQETHDRDLFRRWRRGQDFDARARARGAAMEAGLLVEDGMLVGAGAPPAALAGSVAAMAASGARQIRAMGYVPSPGGLAPAGDAVREELLAIAVMRLARPGALIPASLDVEGLKGLIPRIRAGANVATSLVPAGSGLAGVASKELDIDNRNRGAGKVAEALAGLGLAPAAPGGPLAALAAGR